MIKVNVGDKYTASIYGNKLDGVIQIERGRVYLCQNVIPGAICDNALGYKYSWHVSEVEQFNKRNLINSDVEDFVLIPSRKSRIEKLNI